MKDFEYVKTINTFARTKNIVLINIGRTIRMLI
jgi:hypothetical protein